VTRGKSAGRGATVLAARRPCCSIDLLEASAGYFALPLGEARVILKAVAAATSTWRDVARQAGAPAKEIHRMASAFEHDALQHALALP
jgi:serine/threonine-protein kinase HipA